MFILLKFTMSKAKGLQVSFVITSGGRGYVVGTVMESAQIN